MDLIRITMSERNEAMIKVMSNYSTNPESVGIFWFDRNDLELFGVESIPVEQVKHHAKKDDDWVSINKLHKEVWDKRKHKAMRRQHPDWEDQIFLNTNYVDQPRGRVVYKPLSNKFDIMVGSWYEEYKDVLTDLIQEEFNLVDFEFIVEDHWEIGNGF